MVTDRALTPEELRAWLDRPPPPLEPLVCLVHGTERCAHDQEPDERDWYEFDLAREADTQMEAGHA